MTNREPIKISMIQNNIDEVVRSYRQKGLLPSQVVCEYLEYIKQLLDELEPNKQIRWERDIAIQQLNELGYQFGEKIRSDEE